MSVAPCRSHLSSNNMRTLFRDIANPKVAFSVVILFCVFWPLRVGLAAHLREAQVTQVVKEVQLLPGQATARPAAVNERIRDNTAVRTGSDSRAELTFTDQTLARLGANTLFSFNEGARNLDLGGGAMLLSVPKGAPSATVRTAAVTAAISGGTALLEYHKHTYCKFISLEGTMRLYLKSRLGESILLYPGQMLIFPPGARELPDPVDVDLDLLMKTCLFITEFRPLDNRPLITEATYHQQDQKADGLLMDTNLVIVGRGTLVSLVDSAFLEQRDQARRVPPTPPTATPTPTPGSKPTPTPSATPTPTPGSTPTPTPNPTPNKFGTPPVITSSNPYVITSGTTISTDPAIATTGTTDFGKIYRGPAQDGAASAWMFGATSPFDTTTGVDLLLATPSNLPMAAFKFTNLVISGNPTISTANGGATSLALIGVSGLSTSAPGGTLTFSGLNLLLLATQSGAITLTSDVTFSNLQFLFFYARGAGSNLTVASPLTNIATAQLDAEGSVQVNGGESVTTFRSIAGVDFLDGTGHVVAQNISIIAGNNINFTTNDFAVAIATHPNVFLQAGASANVDVRTDQSVFANATALTITGQTITLTADPGGTTIGFNDLTPVQFTAGTGGIQASQVSFLEASNSINFQSAGDVNAARIIGGNSIQSTAGNINTSGDLNANLVLANGSITSGGDLFGFQSITAGTTINVTNTLLSPQVVAGGNITDGHLQVRNINHGIALSNTTLTAGSGGITPFRAPSGSALLHTFNVSSIQSPKGIDFSGIRFGTASNGGVLTINAQSQTISGAGINGANFNGADQPDAATPAGSGGTFTLNTNADLTVAGANIDATTGVIATSDVASGAGGTVNLTSVSGPVSVNNSRVQVSSNDPGGLPTGRRLSARGGSINISSGANAGVAINITNTAQLLSLLQNLAPGPGGLITVKVTAPTGGSQINLSGPTIQADRGGIDVRHSSDLGRIDAVNSNMSADIIKIATLGDKSTLNVGGGLISAGTLLRLYAGSISGSNNATINFVQSCQLNGNEIDIAAHTVNLGQNVIVTTGSQANVFTTVANYQGFGGTGGPTTGTFGGAGAKTQPLLNAPPLGSPGGP